MENSEKKIILTDSSPREIAEFAVSVLDQRKARDIKLLHVEARTVIADYFIIATGNSRTQIKALADELEFRLEEAGVKKAHNVEGGDGSSWILLDFGSLIVHVFSPDARKFYQLEKLYADASEEDISALINEE